MQLLWNILNIWNKVNCTCQNCFLIKLFLDKPDQYTFDNVVDPLISEEYDVDYAFNTLLVKMLTDWTECSNKAFDADFHHVINFPSFKFSAFKAFR